MRKLIVQLIKFGIVGVIATIIDLAVLMILKEYFNVLNEREKEIIIKRYGLNNEDEKTQKEIASDLGISRSYVSRIEKRALTKMLREFIKNKDN